MEHLTQEQVTRSLEAYVIWLLGKVMFTETHQDTITARWVPIALEIAAAQNQEDIEQRSWGSALLAATYRALCTVCTKNSDSSSILGCPLFLQLWSWERFPVGRPDVDATRPWDYRLIDHNAVDLPTFGSMWAYREVPIRYSITLKLGSSKF